jgi:hypothetical protein
MTRTLLTGLTALLAIAPAGATAASPSIRLDGWQGLPMIELTDGTVLSATNGDSTHNAVYFIKPDGTLRDFPLVVNGRALELDDGSVLLGNADGDFYRTDSSGEVLSEFDSPHLPARGFIPSELGNGNLVLGTRDRHVDIVTPEGALVRRIPTASAPSYSLRLSNGGAFVLSRRSYTQGPYEILFLSPTGKALAQETLSQQPLRMAIEHAGQVVVPVFAPAGGSLQGMVLRYYGLEGSFLREVAVPGLDGLDDEWLKPLRSGNLLLQSFAGGACGYLVLDPQGNTLNWTPTLCVSHYVELESGNVFVFGQQNGSTGPMFTYLLDPAGELINSTQLPDGDWEESENIIELPSGNVLVPRDQVMFELSPDGELVRTIPVPLADPNLYPSYSLRLSDGRVAVRYGGGTTQPPRYFSYVFFL